MNLLNGKVRVYNYRNSSVGFPSNVLKKGNFISGKDKDKEYTMKRILWEDIEEENANSDIFRTGMLRFHPDEEDEIYKKLGIEDRENILADEDIVKVLLNDSMDNLKRINNIKSFSLITRMKSMLFNLERVGKSAPIDIINVINDRYDSLRNQGKKNEKGYLDSLLEKQKKANNENELTSMIKKLSEEFNNLKQEKQKSEQETKKSLTDLLKIVQDLKKENAELKNNKGKRTTAKASSEKSKTV
ncbi:hypothetical protein ACFHWD_04050 [Clostridium sp. MT-14]|uniref:hypothetical protein n=1 Tax=Clostridium sp. MT-14 TaxID=3348360 RepID=UPI0035F44C3F